MKKKRFEKKSTKEENNRFSKRAKRRKTSKEKKFYEELFSCIQIVRYKVLHKFWMIYERSTDRYIGVEEDKERRARNVLAMV